MLASASSHASSRQLLQFRQRKQKSGFVGSSLHKMPKGISMSPLHIGEGPTKKNIPIYLLYEGQRLSIRCWKGTPYKQMITLLYDEILHYELKKGNSNAEQICKKMNTVLGFSTINNDIKTDYLISILKGKVTRSLILNCFGVGLNSQRKSRFFSNRSLKKSQMKYEIYYCLAVGGFSKVYLVRSYSDGKFYAAKFIRKSDNNNQNDASVRNQIQISSELNYPFLLSMKEGFETEHFYCLILQYCPGGELFFLLRRRAALNEEQARYYFGQILLGIGHLHSKGILYRDLKPENVLIDCKGNLKIADFGLSKHVKSEKDRSFSYCGSAEYMAPQMVMRAGHGRELDFYSLGALLYELVTGLPPFYSRDKKELQTAIVSEQIAFPSNIPLSDEIKDLLQRLLTKSPKLRLGTFGGIKEIMMHPWVGKLTIEDYLGDKCKMKVPFVPNLQQHNFDTEDLGDDESEFNKQILNDFMNLNSSKNKNLVQKETTCHNNYGQIIQMLVKRIDNGFCDDRLFLTTNRNSSKEKISFRKQKSQGKSKQKQNRDKSINSSHVFHQDQSKLGRSFCIFNSSDRFQRMERQIKEKVLKSPSKHKNSYSKLLPYLTKTKLCKPSGQEGTNMVPRANILKLKKMNCNKEQ